MISSNACCCYRVPNLHMQLSVLSWHPREAGTKGLWMLNFSFFPLQFLPNNGHFVRTLLATSRKGHSHKLSKMVSKDTRRHAHTHHTQWHTHTKKGNKSKLSPKKATTTKNTVGAVVVICGHNNTTCSTVDGFLYWVCFPAFASGAPCCYFQCLFTADSRIKESRKGPLESCF